MLLRLFVFLLLNFGALALGGFLMGEGPASEWYSGLNQAPWTPPGWVFGAAWTTIMICYTIYMAYGTRASEASRSLLIVFGFQWVLNVIWNPTFFYFHQALTGMIVISLLTILVGFQLFTFRKQLKLKSLLLLPYFVWLIIATSLNAYILMNN